MSEFLGVVGEAEDRAPLIGLHRRRCGDAEEALKYIGAMRQQPLIHLERMVARK